MSAIPRDEQIIFHGGPSAIVVTTHVVRAALWAVAVYLLYHFGVPRLAALVAEQAAAVGSASSADAAAAADWVRRVGFYAMVVLVTLLGWRAIIGGARLVTLRYTITPRRIQLATGLLSRHIENIEMPRIADVTVQEPLFLRLFGQGDLIIVSADRTMPWLRLHGLPKPRALMATILQCARPTGFVEMR